MYQPEAMRWRGVPVLTNTPPRRAQSQPGGMQGITMMEPVMAKAARKLGVDQVQIRRINAPVGKAKVGPANARGQRAYTTSAFVQEALDKGKVLFNWDERKARSGKVTGTKVRGVGVAVSTFVAGSTGFDGLFVIKPDGHMYIHRASATWAPSRYRHDARRSRDDGHAVGEGRDELGQHVEQPAVVVRIRRQPDDARAYARGPCGGDRCDQEAARRSRRSRSAASRKTMSSTTSALQRKGGGGGMTLAQVAQKALDLGGKFDGHELPDDINAVTKRSATNLAGQGLLGVGRDNYKRDGDSYWYVAGFAEVEIDKETGKYDVIDYAAVADVGTVDSSTVARWPGAGPVSPGHGARAQPEDGVRPALRRRAGRRWYQNGRRRSSTFRST